MAFRLAHRSPVGGPAPLQANTSPLAGEDLRKYEVGRELRFVAHDPQEQVLSGFEPGDVLRPLERNGCGMGIDVRRESDGFCDMVWADEVELAKEPA